MIFPIYKLESHKHVGLAYVGIPWHGDILIYNNNTLSE